MVDPRSEAVMFWSVEQARWKDKTAEVEFHAVDGDATLVRFTRGRKTYRYGAGKVLSLSDPVEIPFADDDWIEVCGNRLRDATSIYRFEGPAGAWLRIFSGGESSVRHELFAEQDVRILGSVMRDPGAGRVLAYWRRIVSSMPHIDNEANPLQFAYNRFRDVHPESVLARYLTGQPIGDGEDPAVGPIFPFDSNLSQRTAVQNALRFPISVIEGPPGTGKTQTILNVISTLIATPGMSVGVVSFNNAAVENVRAKLEREGYGYVVANLGRREKRDLFFNSQVARNSTVDEMLKVAKVASPEASEVAVLAARLNVLQNVQWSLAALKQEAEAHRLEREHFLRFLHGQDIRDLDGLPLLRRSSEHLLSYLVDTQLEEHRSRPLRWLRRLRLLIKYGPLRGTDQSDTDLLLRVQHAYYDRRIAELDQEITIFERRLEHEDLPGQLEEYRVLSERTLRTALRDRYASQERVEYDSRSYRRKFGAFNRDYPVILSTCHSLRGSIGEDQLLDYLIIDEASQVDLLTVALALSSCRRVVVVGDQRQLAHIVDEKACKDTVPPAPEYDYRAHSILSSLQCLYGASLPTTMLREHYRCDPAIIGFCNEKFYGGQLIPLTTSTPDSRPMMLVRTVEGNHMREHRGGGRTNRREVDVILNEVIPHYCADIFLEDIGIATPYRRQVTAVTDALSSAFGPQGGVEADTVHRYQGREKRAVIMSAVLDDSANGRGGVRFVDDPRLVNVAVSRAAERFILVTDHRMLPTSRNLRDLMGYIRYRDPENEIVDSTIVSVFDLLYRSYSARLRPLAARLRGQLPQRSEDIVWTILGDILSQEQYAGLEAVPQVLVRNLVPRLADLTGGQAAFVRRRSSVDIVVYNRVTRSPLLAIEIDGFAYHENNPVQLARDMLKNEVLAAVGLPLLRLRTTGSEEHKLITQALDHSLGRAS
ncbi:AAA family ATPase [Arthrobacter sp. CDRTa11]|uniref:AAA domain-containing protein n=1 Tax=Arthrobacter sp. CDRTa11 TaxID=2651199 RepID=UPI0022659F75|nr:AAA domain-containing protein [Arthrobacter sp. CDRTa11]UZX03630.1 AAA family ATPase [Arthrobacter sp. CDRTa11]